MTQRGYAVVTGASSGIGAASARALAKEGYQVIAAARRVDMLADLAKENQLITAWELDVTDQASVDALAAHLADKTVNVLVATLDTSYTPSRIVVPAATSKNTRCPFVKPLLLIVTVTSVPVRLQVPDCEVAGSATAMFLADTVPVVTNTFFKRTGFVVATPDADARYDLTSVCIIAIYP